MNYNFNTIILDNPVFLETEKLIARCIQRTNEIELETEEEVSKQSETELNIQAEVTAVTNIKVFKIIIPVIDMTYLVYIRTMLTLTS